MIATSSSPVIHVRVQSRQELDSALDQAVHAVTSETVSGHRQGIVVTRHTYSDFTVSLSRSVPYGEIHEVVDF